MRRLVVTAAVLLVLALPLAYVVRGVRTKDPRFLDRFIRLQRDVLNRGMMTAAGRTNSPIAVIEHIGRSSGRSYETPVTAFREGDDWVIGLPYGPEVSWAKNVLTAGEAVLRIDGDRHVVNGVRVVPIASTALATRMSAVIRLFGVESAMVLHDASVR
ncbi:nitroreductase/quinone reductase family protein [Microbacterium hominis]|uniref:Nitroreductase family deazaflavin-dependent oxidoreductase n=1 Tax=Microbacterium hominis TaxID=162426 RepID=A0A7D4Q2Q4_9MICO|nr:nitroreductase/quinone reductase family protein [Microbacterium hominis]QKJ20818.1 nitroreductase family deazaflavin-dependent oxidoreductase [Microbacterium hominis]